MRRVFVLIVLNLVLMMTASSGLFADETQKRYERKSVSSIDTVVVLSSVSRDLSGRAANMIKDNIARGIELKRFDYNVLPQAALSLFYDGLKKENNADSINVERLRKVIESTIAPYVENILDRVKELRSREFVSEIDRNRFISLKAKESGIDAADMEKVLNSAFIYIPVVTHFDTTLITKKRADDKVDTYCRARLGVSIIWYKIDYANNRYSIRFLREISAFSSFSAKKGERHKTRRYGNLKDYEYAIYRVSSGISRMLAKKTKDMAEFKLYAPIIEAVGNRVGINIGSKEGILLDDRYFLNEFTKTGGKTKIVRRGYFMISKVGDNETSKSVLSYGYAIKGTPEIGLLSEEKPLMGVESLFSFGVLPFSEKQGTANISGITITDTATQDKTLPFVELALTTDFGKYINKRQLYFELSAKASLHTLNLTVADTTLTEQHNLSILLIPQMGIQKRFQIKSFALGIGSGLDFRLYRIFGSAPADAANFVLTQRSIGAYLKADIIYSLTITSDFVLGIEYHTKNLVTDWSAKYDGTQIKSFVPPAPPNFDFAGRIIKGGFNFYF